MLFAFNPSARGAPAAPNKAVLTGTVREASGISSSELGGGVEQPFCKLVVRVETVTEVEGYANFLKEREGRYITVYSNGRCPSELAGRRIRATVSYEGDERDGLFLMESLDGVK